MSVSVIEKGYNGSTLVSLKSKLYEKRIIFLEGEINSETACEFTREMMFLMKNNDEPITVFINSNGGEVMAGLQIVDVISSCKVPVYVCCLGHAYSIAALILSSGKKGHRFILPLCYINSYADIRFLAEAIVMANPRKKNSSADPYWDDAAISLLCAEITYVILTVKNPSFADVVALNNELEFVSDSGAIVTNLDGRIERESKRETSPFLMTCWRTFKNLPIKTAGCVHSTLNTTLDTIFSPELLSMIKEKKKIDFSSLTDEKTILFVLTSAVNPAIHSFVNLFYGQMFKDLYEIAEKEADGALEIPVHCICDDFACGSPVHNFAEYIAIFREKNISVTLMLQSEQQLESIYGFEDSRTILNCCDTYIYMGGNEIQSARSVAERCNKPVHEILYMPIGSEIIMQRQAQPIFTTRYNILKNEVYKEVTKEYEEKISRDR